MSNKTNLQTLNSNYSTLIETLRGKAVGGGSGGTSKKTVTITVTGQYYYYACYITEDGTAKRVANNGATVEALGGALLKSAGNAYRFAVVSGEGVILNANTDQTGSVGVNHNTINAALYDMCVCTKDGSVVSINRSGGGGSG